jgi:hypothetical protein
MSSNGEALELDDFNGDIAADKPPEDNARGTNREWLKQLPGLLRSFGAAAVLFSLYNFFARGWEGSGDLIRYLMLLGHTGALAAIGLASGHFLREGKGARLLLTLALVSVVANFAILGAFIFSGLYHGQLGNYPSYLTWSVGGSLTALLTTAGSLAILLPVVRIGFLTLARGISKRMTILFLLGNAALLLPVRAPEMVTALTLAMAALLLFWCGKSLRDSTEVKTREGMVALALQFIPISVLIGRNLWLYSSDSLLYTMAIVAAFIAVRQLSLFLGAQSLLRGIGNKISLILSGMTGVGIYTTLLDAGTGGSAALIGATLTSAAMIYEVGLRSGVYGSGYRSFATAVAVLGLGFNLIAYGGFLSAILTMGVGIALVAASYVAQNRSTFTGGITLLLGSMVEQLVHAFRLFDLGSWASLAVVGIAAILIGSLLESRGGQLKSRLMAWKSRYSEWTY